MKNLVKYITVISCIVLLTSSKPEKNLYDELYRPQFHFTSEKNWIGGVAGLVYYDSEFHVFYQYNPQGNDESFMHWGHAISNNLVQWEHLPVALNPGENKDKSMSCPAHSGSVIVDQKNLLGMQQGEAKTLVAFYSGQQCGQCIAYSTDKGRTWNTYQGNPVIGFSESDDARHPRVIWHEPTEKYIMVLYRKTSDEDRSKGVSFYSSENLVDWQYESHIYGYFEYPDLFPMKVSNRPEEIKWILFDGDGSYLIGNFNGKNFSPETARMKIDMGNNFYATQSFRNIPESDGRIIQIAWMKGGNFPEMPFNGQLTFPSELTLSRFSFGYKLSRKPVKEIEVLHGKKYNWENKKLIPGINQNIVKSVNNDCLHIVGEFDIKNCSNFGFYLRRNKKHAGTELIYDARRGTLSLMGVTVPLEPVDNRISLEILVDRSSIELFANNGLTVISSSFTPEEGAKSLLLFSTGGEIVVDKLDIFEMNPAWKTGK